MRWYADALEEVPLHADRAARDRLRRAARRGRAVPLPRHRAPAPEGQRCPSPWRIEAPRAEVAVAERRGRARARAAARRDLAAARGRATAPARTGDFVELDFSRPRSAGKRGRRAPRPTATTPSSAAAACSRRSSAACSACARRAQADRGRLPADYPNTAFTGKTVVFDVRAAAACRSATLRAARRRLRARTRASSTTWPSCAPTSRETLDRPPAARGRRPPTAARSWPRSAGPSSVDLPEALIDRARPTSCC